MHIITRRSNQQQFARMAIWPCEGALIFSLTQFKPHRKLNLSSNCGRGRGMMLPLISVRPNSQLI